MTWSVKYLPEALQELESLEGSSKILVRKAIQKVSQNPLPDYKGGYGHPLSNKHGINLAGFMKIKLKAAGLRIVYKIECHDNKMLIIIIGVRADNEVYEAAIKRIQKYQI